MEEFIEAKKTTRKMHNKIDRQKTTIPATGGLTLEPIDQL